MENQKKLQKAITISIVGFIVLIVVSVAIYELFLQRNPYGRQIKIDNLSSYYPDIPEERRDSIFATLFRVVSENTNQDEKIPKRGALVRKGTNHFTFDEKTGVTYIDFIVDIESLQQSYNVQYEWADNVENEINLSGYQGLVTCIKDPELIIYKDFKCKDMFTDDKYSDFVKKYPIIQDLPVIVDYYSNNYADYTHYTITYNATQEDYSDFSLIINDYTGNNYNVALDKIRELGFDPNDYKIIYDDSYVFVPPVYVE